MTSILYFAYGSNMLAQRLQARCKSARPRGVATLSGYGLEFSKRGMDGSGKATLVVEPAGQVYGVVFDIGADDLTELDRIEGRGNGYDRIEELPAQTYPDKRPITVTTYIGQDGFLDRALIPYDWYRDLVLRGAEQNSLPIDYVARLQAVPALGDPVVERTTRLEALAILAGLEQR